MQNNLALNETYFSFCCTIPAELVELWNWFCFEKGALGTETLQESSLESSLKIFYPKNQMVVHKNYLNVSKGK